MLRMHQLPKEVEQKVILKALQEVEWKVVQKYQSGNDQMGMDKFQR